MDRSLLTALIVASALLMENLDSTVISTSLPLIAADLGTSPLSLKLAMTSYMLSLAVFIPASGWVADRFGARNVFRIALVIFIAGSILSGLSQSLEQLVVCRVIQGIGGSNLYLVDRYGAQEIYDVDFLPIEGAESQVEANSRGLTYLDHLTHNVQRCNMVKWADFYEKIFNFREIRYFDIEGKQTALVSKAMTSPDGKIRIPLNESQDEHSQIEEFLKDYKGEGIQHIALGADDIYESVEAMREQGVLFQDTIDTYFDGIEARIPGHGEDVQRLQANKILIDGAPTEGQGLLLQIFTENMIGPIFFELIQRKGNEGFGEGNFKALFESIELDQIRRGVLPAKA